MKVYFIFVYNEKWWAILSPVIRRVEKTDFSHCAIAIEDGSDFIVYESTWPQGKRSKYSEFRNHYRLVHQISIPVPEGFDYKVKRFLESNVGIEYSFMQLVTLAIGRFSLKAYNYFKALTWNGTTSQICSELMARFIERFGLHDFDESFDFIGCREVFGAVQGISFRALEGDIEWKEVK